ncbi:MAG TPA: alpha-isopropylmalate synthase regulatory domain-containing protein [Syntrophorhabdaceae bacterium]|nr:alpha-isopropylmalate synthase regulatory domain-containing protein [Syntrophorhabdaceae bacterium]
MKKLLNITDATKELNILRSRKGYKSPFKAVGTYRLIDDGLRPEATVIIETEKQRMHEASTGVGPVDALANVLKKSLSSIFPVIQGVKLVDFSSRIHDSKAGTSAKVEVNIIFSDGNNVWSVVAISENINMASFMALLDGFEYAILSGRLSEQEKR